MKHLLFTLAGLILGGLVGSLLWGVADFILEPLLVLILALGGAYFGYNYSKTGEILPSSKSKTKSDYKSKRY